MLKDYADVQVLNPLNQLQVVCSVRTISSNSLLREVDCSEIRQLSQLQEDYLVERHLQQHLVDLVSHTLD